VQRFAELGRSWVLKKACTTTSPGHGILSLVLRNASEADPRKRSPHLRSALATEVRICLSMIFSISPEIRSL
jgi:hypothetical protein